MSNRPRRASDMSLSSPGRLAFVPLMVSEYSPTISYPRAAAKGRRSQSCVSGCWSTLETRVYRTALFIGSVSPLRDRFRSFLSGIAIRFDQPDGAPAGDVHQERVGGQRILEASSAQGDLRLEQGG